MRVQLVTMPWHPIDLPSLQVGLLHRLLRQVRPDDEVREFHGSLRWAEFLLEHSAGRLRPADYEAIGSDSIFDGLGDWVFSGALYDDADWGVARLKEYAAARDLCIDTASAMRAHAADFILACATEVLAQEPDVVGFTTTFMQNVPSLALAQELKRRRPGLTIVFGGSNCDGPMGHALHHNHPFVDHVVRGEGEYAFPALLRHLDAGTPPADVPGLCWWDGTASRANTESRRTVAPADIPAPDYDQWQAALEASPVLAHVYPKLVVEGARGCWWGEKHHCTFLRECQSHGFRTRWEAAYGDTCDTRMLHHLPPPAERPGEQGGLAEWRSAYAAFPTGMLHHRRGPDFVTVMDRRERPTSARLTLDDPDLVATFGRVQDVTAMSELDAVQREAVDLLAAERLALVADGWVVALPTRLRRWPVPCTGI
ncbi:DUF5825 family protein [Streptomyces sp. V3I7]|uniref:DUF5825 family protein n=1 Tax=Streptomyces sp. V3I7 TaxID=3042278 RepID=UPI0027832ED2|nr:DUF5825 family protein [Streptomyces sp. V3I7]MDQ0989583.1 hypothetical protein [Streptomyces sp. V3I7]